MKKEILRRCIACNEQKNKKEIGLTTKIFIALIAGAIVGIILNYLVPAGTIRDQFIINGVLYVIGQGFIRLKMVTILIFFSSHIGAMFG